MTRTTALLLSLLLAAAPALAQPPILERNAELAAIDARLLGLWHQVDVQDGAPKTVEVSPSHWAVAVRGPVAEVGWIDAGRFGPESARAAWLIVQHSGDLRLMQTVLPEIVKQVRAGAADAGRFALLASARSTNTWRSSGSATTAGS